MKKIFTLIIFLVLSTDFFAQTYFDSEKKLATMEGITIKDDGTVITDKDGIISFKSYSGYDTIANTWGLKLQSFTYENTKYVLLNEGDYRYFLIKEEDWKTNLYKNTSNVNIIPICGKLFYDDLIERNLDTLILEFKKQKIQKSDLVIFTYYDENENKVNFLSSIFFSSYNYYNSFPDDYEYPSKLPENYYFKISADEFIDFFNSTIKDDIASAITEYNYNTFNLIEDYDKYEDKSWFNSYEQYKIFSKDNIDFEFYIGKFSSGTKTLRMTLKTMGCDKYYDCIKSVIFIRPPILAVRLKSFLFYSFMPFSYVNTRCFHFRSISL